MGDLGSVDALHTLFRFAVTAAFLVTAPLVLLGYQYRGHMPLWLRRVYAALLVCLIGVLGRYALKQVVVTVEHPPEWHISAFWLYGRVAVSGQDYYAPAALHREGDRLNPSQAFSREILDVGLPYPPPTILFIAPLGYLDLRGAALAWQMVTAACLLAIVVLLWRLFLARSGALGLAVIAALTLGLRATHWNIELTQSSLVVLLFVVLFWAARDRWLGGILLALGTAVKPLMALLGLFPLLRAQWKVCALAVAGYGVLSVLAIVLFGWSSFLSFFISSPLHRIPGWMYTGHNSQSLLAMALRASGVGATAATLDAPWRNPLFLSLAAIVLVGTVPLVYLLPRLAGPLGSELALGITLCASLLLYPNTLNHYTVLLIPPLLFIWTRAADLRINPLLSITLITATYWLVWLRGGDVSIAAIALLWGTLAFVGGRLLYRAKPVGAMVLTYR
jgi:hypothetical protein